MSAPLSRLNTVFSFLGIVLASLVVANVLTTYFVVADIDVNLKFNRMTKL